MSSDSTKLPSLDQYIAWAEHYIERCRNMKSSIKGAAKLERRCTAELRFLKKLVKKASSRSPSNELDVHLKSSNLSHYAAIIHVAETLPDVTHLLQPFSIPERQDNLVVDVIAQKGHLWMKVIARKAQALHLIWAGQGQFGEKDIIKQAEEFLKCTECYPYHYQPPKLHYTFYGGITYPMAQKLEEMGVTVWGNRVDVSEEVEQKLKMDQVDSEFMDEFSDDLSDNNEIFHHSWGSDSDVDNGSGEDDVRSINTGTAAMEIVTASKDVKDKNLGVEDCGLVTSVCVEEPHHQSKVDDDCLTCEKPSDVDLHNESDIVCGEASIELSSAVCRCPDKEKDLLGLSGLFSLVPDYSSLLKASSGVLAINKVNLDITTLLTMVAAVSHGRHGFVFKEKVLTDQAAEEREFPVLPRLQEFLKGKELIACETAIHAFNTIVNTLAGPEERKRADELLEEIKIVPDDMSERCKHLPLSSKLKARSKIIFGTGDKLQAVTVTANSGFVRAAKHQGVNFPVFFHQARALTEIKEKVATKISEDTS